MPLARQHSIQALRPLRRCLHPHPEPLAAPCLIGARPDAAVVLPRGKFWNDRLFLLDMAVDKAGCISTELRPSLFDHQGLGAALEWQAQELFDPAGLTPDLRVHVVAGVGAEPAALADSRTRARASSRRSARATKWS